MSRASHGKNKKFYEITNTRKIRFPLSSLWENEGSRLECLQNYAWLTFSD